MKLLYRRIIFLFFVILFCILVPVILLYATGHTINWRRLSLEKTASILIDSEPSGATVFLNNEQLNSTFLEVFTEKTPLTTKAKVNNLEPGEYTIKLIKDGYWPWEEKFRLSPGEVANFNKIGLFTKANPVLIYEANNTKSILSPDGKIIALVNNNLLEFISLDNEKISEVKLTDANLKKNAEINWSNNNKKLSLDSYIINPENKTVINLNTEVKKNTNLLRWGNNDDIIYFVNSGKIFSYTISNKTINELNLNKQLNGLDIIDYLIKNDKIYIITKFSDVNEKLLFGSLEENLNSVELPSGDYVFDKQISPKPVLISDKKFYVLDEPLAIFSKPRLLLVSDRFKLGHWQDNSLTYSTGIELRRWDKESQEYLMTRLGSPINELQSINKKNSVAIATKDDLQIYVNGSQPFSINLAPIKNINLITISGDNKTLYVYGEYQNKTGIFRLTL